MITLHFHLARVDYRAPHPPLDYVDLVDTSFVSSCTFPSAYVSRRFDLWKTRVNIAKRFANKLIEIDNWGGQSSRQSLASAARYRWPYILVCGIKKNNVNKLQIMNKFEDRMLTYSCWY